MKVFFSSKRITKIWLLTTSPSSSSTTFSPGVQVKHTHGFCAVWNALLLDNCTAGSLISLRSPLKCHLHQLLPS